LKLCVADWSGDSWITYTYMPGHLRKVHEVRLQHSMSLGRRYDNHSKAKFLPEIVSKSKDTISRYFRKRKNLRISRHLN
jgi:hypothetical protein